MKRKNKLLLAIMCACTAFGFSLLSACTGSYKLEAFVVDGTTVPKEYTLGDTVDFSAVDIYATFTDESKEDIPLDSVKIYLDDVEITGNLSKITETVGNKVLVFKYSDKEVRFDITVNPPKAPAKVESVAMNSTDVVKTYEVGATNVSLEGLTITATYDDDTTENVALTSEKLTILCNETDVTSDLNKIAESKGTKKIEIIYDTVRSTDFFNIEITNPLTGISVSTASVKTAYKVGETVDFSALAVTATYKDTTTSTVALTDVKYYLGETEITDFNALTTTVGTKTITVKYQDKTANFDFSVTNFVTAIALDTTGVQLNYVADEPVAATDFAGVKVNVTWADNTDANAVKQLTLTSADVTCTLGGNAVNWENLTAIDGNQVITVTYSGKTATFTVNVAPGETALDTLTVLANPTTTSYTAGANVSLDGLKIKAQYKEANGGHEEEIAYADFATKGVKMFVGTTEITNANAIAQVETLGTTNVQVTVRYNGKNATFTIAVTNTVQSIELVTTNVKTAYNSKDIADFSQLTATATLDYGEKDLTANDVTFFVGTTQIISGTTRLVSPNWTEVTVKYGDKTATFNITVTDWVESLTASGTTEFTCDYGAQAVDFTGLTLTATYASGETKDVTSEATKTFNTNTLGAQTVTFTYGEKTATATLNVETVLKSIEIVNTSWTQAEKDANKMFAVKNGTFNLKGKLAVVVTYTHSSTKESVSLLIDSREYFKDEVSFDIYDGQIWTSIGAGTTVNVSSITQTVGDKQVRLNYEENGHTVSVEFIVQVSEGSNWITEMETPATLTKYQATLASTTDDTSTSTTNEYMSSTEGNFYATSATEDVYLVGDDNPFKLLPIVTQMDIASGTYSTLVSFTTNTTVQMKVGEEYVALSASKASDKITYKYEGTTFVTETVGKNEYQFSEAAVNHYFKLSIMPSADDFDWETSEINPVVWEMKVVDGYNIHESKQLGVLEQSDRTEWNNYKALNGLTGIRPKSVILHQDTIVSLDAIPEEFYYTLGSDYDLQYSYVDPDTQQKVTCKPEEVPASVGGPLSRSFLWNQYDGNLAIFEYHLNAGETFSIHGNYFDLDASKLPLVASFDCLNDIPASEKPANVDVDAYYGSDFSNTVLLEIYGQVGTKNEADENFYFYNFAMKGNAQPYDVINANYQDNPVYGGGLIFVEMQDTKALVDNVRAINNFISYFADWDSDVTLSRTKSYDNFQQAIYYFAAEKVTVTNSDMRRSAGPLILSQQVIDGDNRDTAPRYVPHIEIDANSTMESYLTGKEQWFATVGADSQIAQLAVVDQLLNGYFQKSMYKNGKFNLVIAQIGDMEDDMYGMNYIDNQGYAKYGNVEMNRTLGSDMFNGIVWAATPNDDLQKPSLVNTFAVGGQMCYVGPGNYNGYGLNTINAWPPSDISTNHAVLMAFGNTNFRQQPDYVDYKHVVLNMGGYSLLMGYHNFVPATT